MNRLTDVPRAESRMATGLGFAIAVIGILCLMAPFVAGVAINTAIAIALVAAGLTLTAYAFKAGKFGKGLMQFLFGGVTIAAGVALFSEPMIGLFSLTMVLAGWFVIDGILNLAAGISGKGLPGRGWVIVNGIASLLLGGLLLAEWPADGMYAVGMLTGIRLIMSGWTVAMLGMVGDSVVDVVDDAVDEIVDVVQGRPGASDEGDDRPATT